MPNVLPKGRYRSFQPVENVEPSAPVRRERPSVPVLREEVVGVKFSEYLGLPAEIHNHITGMLPELQRRLYEPLQLAFRSGIEDQLEGVVTDVIPAVSRWFGRALIGMLLTHHRGFLGTYICCAAQTEEGKPCPERLEYQREQRSTVKTMMGEVVYHRSYYRGSCGHSAWPLDTLLGIDDRHILPNLQEEIGLLSSQMPYEHALATVTRWAGMPMSKRTVEGVTQELADEKREEQEAERVAAFENQFTIPVTAQAPPGSVGFVSVDGGFCKIVGEEEEREFKVGVFGSFHPTRNRRSEEETDVKTADTQPQLAVTGEPSQTPPSPPCTEAPAHHLKPAPEVLKKRYIGRFEEAETFVQRLTVEFHKAGLAHVDTVNAVTDGAEWIINRLPTMALKHQEWFHVLDWWHTDERLGQMSKLIFGSDTHGQALWLEKMCTFLLEDKLSQFFRALARQVNIAQELHKPDDFIDSLCGNYQYFHKRRHLLRYKEALDRGFIIGSGIMEGGIRFVGKDRLYRTGMKWTPLGAEEVLVLRCVWASGCWPEFQQQRKLARLDGYKRQKAAWAAPRQKAA